MRPDGRITVPAKARRALGIEGATQFTVEIVEGAIVLRPALVIPRDDAWAFTAETRASIARGLADSAAGRVRKVSEEELLKSKKR